MRSPQLLHNRGYRAYGAGRNRSWRIVIIPVKKRFPCTAWLAVNDRVAFIFDAAGDYLLYCIVVMPTSLNSLPFANAEHSIRIAFEPHAPEPGS
ncbi:hypothetical protein KCP69_15190 [Salmonella enterica subsp. enterica]|nr:hypothetical protein KCP69_15190 [Salmonella enterica subsp. enterica]